MPASLARTSHQFLFLGSPPVNGSLLLMTFDPSFLSAPFDYAVAA
jgi:hypothetical protein